MTPLEEQIRKFETDLIENRQLQEDAKERERTILKTLGKLRTLKKQEDKAAAKLAEILKTPNP